MAAKDGKRPSETDDLVDQVLLVAGARNPLDLALPWTVAELPAAS
jgi:hypothetical protein